MRLRIIAVATGVGAALSVLGAVALAEPGTQVYAGRSSSGTISFAVSNGKVHGFIFENRCAGLRHGTPIGAAMSVVDGRFSLRNKQFKVSGVLVPGGTARGTASDRTGDCYSGLLSWTAHATSGAVTPTAAERAGVLKAFGDPAAAARCLIPRIAASNTAYATVRFWTTRSCRKWLANGVSVFHRDSHRQWQLVFAGSSYRCPIPRIPRSVQRDLGVCPRA